MNLNDPISIKSCVNILVGSAVGALVLALLILFVLEVLI